VIVEAIAQWQYLIMGATACTLMAIVLMAIYIADLHHRVNQLSEENAERNALLRSELNMVRSALQSSWSRADTGTWTK
jgi:hypothetical protein